jgi:ankyrin repeat protein
MSRFALIDASSNGNLDQVKQLLSSGADPIAYSNLAVRMASFKGHMTIVLILVDHGADIDWAISCASKENKEVLVQWKYSFKPL